MQMTTHFKIILTAIAICGLSLVAIGQSAHAVLRSADAAYDAGAYVEAEGNYRDAAVIDPSAKAKFNLGNSLFQQERYEEAAQEFQQAMNLSSDTMFRARALYNKGNSLLKKGDLAQSLKAYKKSLLLNPNDADAKRNFMLALQQQQQQEQQQQEQEQDGENNEQQQQQNEPNPDDQNEPEDEERQQPQQEQEQDEQKQEQPEKQEMTREEAEQLLQIIENTDSYVQKKIKKQNAKKKEGKKNW